MKIEVQNLKCRGCANTINNSLHKISGVSAIEISEEDSLVEMELINEDLQEEVLKELTRIGYPPAGENNSLGLKAKSYVSCMIGRVS